MTGQELYRLCRQLVDDPDPTFWTDADVVDALTLGYYEYQNWIADMDPQIYEKKYDFTVSGSADYDLNGILFGSTPSVGRAMKITRIYYRAAGNVPDFGGFITPVANLEQLYSARANMGGYASMRWTLQGRVIKFNVQVSNPFSLYYVPVPNVDWATAINSSTQLDDDTGIWQQLIPYFAVQAYNVKAKEMSPQYQQKFDQLRAGCQRWLSKGRNGNASKWVRSSQTGWGYGGSDGSDW